MRPFHWPEGIVPTRIEVREKSCSRIPDDEMRGSVAHRFEKMVSLHPDRPAVFASGREVTFAELNSTANRVANEILLRRGEVEEPVALLMPNGAKAVAAVYGILKAAKAYVPIDTGFPPARISHMLDDSTARLVVTDQDNLNAARQLKPEGDIINVDDLSDRADENPAVEVRPDALAWIHYTSGSTGRPKGVAMTNRVLMHAMARCIEGMRLGPDERVTMFHSLAFSGSQSAYLGTLLAGGCVCIRDVRRRGTDDLGVWLREAGVTVYISVPTLFRHFAGALPDGERFELLRLVRLMGEAVGEREVELYRRHFQRDSLLVNGYGATESGFNLQCCLDPEDSQTIGRMPIGWPLRDMEILFLDDEGREVPPGEPGDIAVRTEYLAEGYWRKPEITRTKFLHDPEGGAKRIYLTGDVGLRLENGCIIHMGRNDFQVKIRGHRVETASVEAALSRMDSIHEAVTVARDDGQAGGRLVAYVVPEPGREVTASNLRRHLARSLPDYMVPEGFVVLSRLPLTESGKVDRNALPEPPRARPALDNPYRTPSTPVETALAKMWAEILGLDQVGVDDDFLDLGGHSLKAAQLVARVRGVLGVAVPLEPLLAASTVARMAVVVTKHLAERAGPGEVERILTQLESPPPGDSP
jgi:amino acid adenylation domain-containing protein